MSVRWIWTKDGMVQHAQGNWLAITPEAAAAPDLLEALRRSLRYFEDCGNGREPANRLMQALRDAIAKAEGR